jgi:putative ABC transport system permease protein
MPAGPATIPLTSLLIGFLPTALVLLVMRQWALDAWGGVYANVRMLAQLLVVGYVLNYIFETNQPLVILGVIAMMIGVSAWIALKPLAEKGVDRYLTSLLAIGASGLATLGLVTQVMLDMPSWFEPRVVVPLAGMIFANAMNTVSLAAERFEAEKDRHPDAREARGVALQAALIPQINALLAVGLVSLPGMMTGQILSGVDPLTAARYQIMVMCMIFGSAGLAAATYLQIRSSR